MHTLARSMAAIAITMAALPWHAHAQAPAWLSKPIRYVVPFAAGGSTEILGRTIAEKLSVALGHPVVVENKPGAGDGLAPDVPTLAESGLPGYEVGSWQGVFAPAGVPPEIAKRLNAETVRILNMPDVQKKMIELGAEPVGDTPEQFGTFVKADVVKWADVVRKSGAKVD